MLKKSLLVPAALLILLASCTRPEKPVARVGGDWVSFEQWQVFLKNRGLSAASDPAELDKALDMLVQREVAFEKAKRKGLLVGKEWENQVERISKSTAVSSYLLEKYLGGSPEPTQEELAETFKSDKARRHIQGVSTRDLQTAKAVAEQLRAGADVKELFEKHAGEGKDGPRSHDLGTEEYRKMPPEIQMVFFAGKDGQVLDPIKFNDECYIVVVLRELVVPPLPSEYDKGTLKKAASLRVQKAIMKANEELKTAYPETFDVQLVSDLMKNERPTEEELKKVVGIVGKDKITYSSLLERYVMESQRSMNPLPRTEEAFKVLFSMIATDSRVAAAAGEAGYGDKPKVKAEAWDLTREKGFGRFKQNFMQEAAVGEKELKDYFEKNRALFITPDRYSLKYLISDNPVALNNAVTLFKTGAAWQDMLKAPGILPETGSGDLGWKTEAELAQIFNPRMMENIKKVEKGKWMADKLGPNRFGLFQVVDKEAGKEASFETCREDVKRRYLADNGPGMIEEYLKGAGRSGIKVETYPQNLL